MPDASDRISDLTEAATGRSTPMLRTTVEAASAEQAHQIALAQGAQFFGVPAGSIKARALSASVKVTTADGHVLIYEVEFEVHPVVKFDLNAFRGATG